MAAVHPCRLRHAPSALRSPKLGCWQSARRPRFDLHRKLKFHVQLHVVTFPFDRAAIPLPLLGRRTPQELQYQTKALRAQSVSHNALSSEMSHPPPRSSSLRDGGTRLHDGEASSVALPIKAMDIPRQPSTASRQPEQTQASKPNTDVLSDKATAAFIRRTLCLHHTLTDRGNVQKPIDELLPPLTSSNEVDLQLYALLAIIVKDYVYTWYAKITPDHVFVDEVIQIVAHCTRALEQRLRKVDLEALLLDEIPSLLDAHLTGEKRAPLCVMPTAPESCSCSKLRSMRR